MDEFGPLNLQSHPGKQWAERGGMGKDSDRDPVPAARDLHPPARGPAPVRLTDYASHPGQGSMIRRSIIWGSGHADHQRLRAVVANDDCQVCTRSE